MDSVEKEVRAADAPAFGIHDGAVIVHCSPELAAMFGHASHENIVGQPALLLVSPEYRDQSIINVMSSGGGPYQSVGLKQNGVRFHMELSAHPVQFQGDVARLFLVRDLSPLALIVDDNSVIRHMMALLLSQLGYRAIQAESAHLGLRLFQSASFTLVVSDMTMPVTSGAEFAARLRAMDPGLPILLMSGSTELPLRLDANSSFIRKPFGLEELSAAIGALPERARAGLL